MILKCFGIARDIFELDELEIGHDIKTVIELRAYLNNSYPALANISSFMIAVNQEYADDNQQISKSDEIAIIPPVSGG